MDFYAVLGVARDAEDVVITAAYKPMFKKYHPDVYSGIAGSQLSCLG